MLLAVEAKEVSLPSVPLKFWLYSHGPSSCILNHLPCSACDGLMGVRQSRLDSSWSGARCKYQISV